MAASGISTNDSVVCSKRWLACACVRACQAFLVCYSPLVRMLAKAVYAPRGAKFYELALVAIAFDPHGRRLQDLSAATTPGTQNNLPSWESQKCLHEPHAYER